MKHYMFRPFEVNMKREYVKGIAGTCRELSFLWKRSLSHNFIRYNYTIV